MRQTVCMLRLLLTGLLSFALCILPLGQAHAELDPGRTGSLTIHCTESIPLPDGALFKLYRIASMDEDAVCKLLPPYDGYPIIIDPEATSAQWQTMADTLARYILTDQVQPLATVTSSNGLAIFPNLQTGLYLVLGDVLVQDGLRYIPTPTLLSIPTRQADGSWQYESCSTPKWDIERIETLPLQVIKTWQDGDAADRPLDVTIQLYGNGELHDTVLLSKANNWRHTWEALDTAITWTVIERPVPDGYTVSIQEAEGLVMVTNTRDEPVPSPTPVPGKPDIPQTGTNWLPTLLLALLGAGLFLTGLVRMQRSK